MTESEFRRRLVRALSGLHVEYMSSMNRPGIPDIHMIVEGRAFWIELKAFDTWPKRPGSNVLKRHRFTGPQLAFMSAVDEAGGRGLGLICDPEGRVIAVRRHHLADDGALSAIEARRHRGLWLGDPNFAQRFWSLLTRA